MQIVHLILAKGSANCAISKHLTKVCQPSASNDHAVAPDKALFKELLEDKDHSEKALRDVIAKTVKRVHL